MGRITGGLLAALVVTLCLATPADADLIPPTAKCEAVMKKKLRVYNRELVGLNKKEEEELDRRFFEGLHKAGCVSAIEPLVKVLPPKPFTEQCAESASAAQAYWGPKSRKLVGLFRRFEMKVERPYKRKSKRLKRRITVLEKSGQSRHARALVRKRKRITHTFEVRARKHVRKVKSLVVENSSGTLLVVFELLAERCVGIDFLLGEGKGPAQQTANRNGILVFTTILFLALKGEDGSSSPKATTSSGLPAIEPPRETTSRAVPAPLRAALAG